MSTSPVRCLVEAASSAACLSVSSSIFLVRAGKIDEETLKHAAEEAASTKQRTGDVLILMGALTEEERLYYVGQQIKSILYSMFAWEEGQFQLSFQARARKEAIKLDILPANLIMRGIKKLYKP